METQTAYKTILERITSIRQEMNSVAGSPEVMALVQSDTWHPDLRIGDAIQALDELAYGLQEFFGGQQRL